MQVERTLDTLSDPGEGTNDADSFGHARIACGFAIRYGEVQDDPLGEAIATISGPPPPSTPLLNLPPVSSSRSSATQRGLTIKAPSTSLR